MLQFTDFKKQYAGFTVLEIPSMELQPGVYWLKGINGSGKSTLLRSLAGLIPFEGQININGTDIKQHKRLHRLSVNYGEAEPVFPDFLTGYDLIDFYVETKQGNKNDCMQQAASLQLNMDALKKKVGSYSSGMLKKLSLILAFVGTPKWILLDEPLITLDVAAVQVMLQLIETHYKKGVSFLLTSHQDVEFPDHSLPLQILSIENKTIVAAQ